MTAARLLADSVNENLQLYDYDRESSRSEGMPLYANQPSGEEAAEGWLFAVAS